MIKNVKLNLIDKIVRYINPKAGLERLRSRAVFSSLSDHGFITPGSYKRSMRGWTPTSTTADEEIIPKLDDLRSGSRDLYSNTPIATAAIRRINTNVVGFGLRLQCRIDRKLLGLSDEKADEWEEKTEREFLTWANSQECDAARTLNFSGLTKLAFFTTLLSGDCFVLVPRIPRKGQLYDLRVKIIEGDYVCNPGIVQDSEKIKGGIEIDEDGAPIKYHFKKSLSSLGVEDWQEIPAYGKETGLRQVYHLYEKERPGQNRGYPLLSPVIEEIKQLTRLSKAEIQAALINAMFTVFIKSESPVSDALQQGYIPNSESLAPGAPGVSTLNANDDRDDVIYEMGAGNMIQMMTNESIDIADPKRPNQNFEPFFLSIVKQIGSALQVPFEQLMLSFNASYSASKAVLQEAWKYYRERRMWLSDNFCQPIYKNWLIEAISKGRVVAPGFFNDAVIQQAWCGAVWAGAGQGQLDPLKETKAAILKIENNLSTYEDEFVSIHGNDWVTAMNRRSREDKILTDLELNPELDKSEDSVNENLEGNLEENLND